MEVSLEQINEMVKPHFPGLFGVEFTAVSPGHSVCKVAMNERMGNPMGVLHGAVHYTLADTGMAMALLPMMEDGQSFTTIEIKMSYFKAVFEGTITCETRVVQKGNRIAFLESEVRDGDTVVARATGTYYIMSRK